MEQIVLDLGKRLSNWGRWGWEDERGTLNLVTPARVLEAAASIRTGRVFELSLPLGRSGPQRPGRLSGRYNPIHTMTILPGDIATADGMFGADDQITMPLQCATQWDSLAHVGYDDLLYNDVRASTSMSALGGASRNSIDKVMPGMVGRGVLLDIARLRGVDWIESADDPIGPAELEAAEALEGVRVRSGDALLVRTGWRRKALVEGWTDEWLASNPGLNLDCAEWLHDREAAIVGSDNCFVEAQPSRVEGVTYPLHCVLIRDMGMMLGEMFDLEVLAADCSTDGQWDFFFSAPPLRIVNAVGTPVSPIAVK